jgi:hypothetical protein
VVPLAGYSVAEKDGRFLLTREAVSPEALPLTMEMGSRKLGLTYLSVLADDTLMETKMSYFPPYKVWDVTPGQEARSPQDGVFGRTHTERESRNCVGCHATVVPAHGLVPEPRFRGVGCEACHGPGRAHVDAMKGGAHPANIRIGRMGLWKPTQINDLCGKCHRTAKDIDLSSPEVNLTQRFQPYALQRSTCRHRDGEPLSCMDCHSPHTNAGTDIKAYEAICLSCHSAASGTAGARHSANNGRQCPVNPTSGCIPCHMRSKPAFALTSMPAKMADHLISIAPKNRP